MRRNSMTDILFQASSCLYTHLLCRHKVEFDRTRNIRSICDLCAYSDFVQFALINATKTLSNHHSPFLLHVILFATLTIVIHLRIARFEIRLHQPTNDCKNDGSRLSNSPIEPGSRARQLLDSGRYRGKVKVITFANLSTKVSGRAPDEVLTGRSVVPAG